MKTYMITLAAGAILMSGLGVAMADTIIVKPDDQKVYREYVHKNPLASIKLPGVELNVGTRLDDKVELREVPNERYQYTVIEGRTVLVDPDTHQVVQVLDAE
ncbi:DUF1236 domain-containing protein [Mesorhizobium sp. PAMC28654]|uniref:DUF1236 domain-containing protein n=1 Tax=Mesorhizobium sp. PAMC28654 TaxID=2880934 RepID=UPI001D0BCBCF|nr:DUF1236 domain-containing protein [Mesorhizobium sp. PAMC28654]UDL88106.1 DUF1236 domain-containing protein [Mesorhizobium sp. PAMC28654]